MLKYAFKTNDFHGCFSSFFLHFAEAAALLTFTFLKSTKETREKGVKYVQS